MSFRSMRYGRQRVAVPVKLMAGGESHVALSGASGPLIVFGRVVEKLPSLGRPVEPKPPAATVDTVWAAMSRHTPVTTGCPPAGPPPGVKQPSPSVSLPLEFARSLGE